MYQIPILFVIFNRPNIASKAFEQIRKIQPFRLYIACDGARDNHEGEIDLVNATRRTIMSEIDWPCEVQTLFQDSNLGCGRGVYTAIDWFFKHNEYGIILEDDCVANVSFFQFMQEMLVQYKDDQRIGMVAGTNLIDLKDYPYSYLFSKYKSCWGWGTWRRAWQLMDMQMSWMKVDKQSVLANAGYLGRDISGWRYKIQCIQKGYVSAWDWQWYFSLAAQNQLCIYPINNLVSNIGTDDSATHTAFSDITKESNQMHFPLVKPPFMAPYYPFDKAFYHRSNTLFIRIARLIPHVVKSRIKTIVSLFRK